MKYYPFGTKIGCKGQKMALRHFSTVPFFCISRCQWKCISLLSRFSNCHNYAIPKSFIKICFWFSSFKRHFLCKHTLVMLSICLVLIFVMRTRLLPKSRVSITISVVASLVKSKHGSPWTSLILFILSSPFFCIVRLLIYYRLLTLYAFILSIIYTFFYILIFPNDCHILNGRKKPLIWLFKTNRSER